MEIMEIVDVITLFIVGLVLIIKGGDWFVDSAIWFAKKTGIPSMIIGATIVSIGTTIPEVCVSLISVIKGLSANDVVAVESLTQMAVGNSIGSMMCNIGLILAIVLCIRPPKVDGKSFSIKAFYLVGVTVLLTVFAWTKNMVELYEAIILLVLFVGFITINVIEAKKTMKTTNNAEEIALGKEEAKRQNSAKMIAFFLIGAGCIGYGANLLVDKGQILANLMGVDTQIVAITFVAIGTSLPELVTSITALRKKDANIGLGNVIGANIINATLLLGLCSVVSGQGLAIDWITRTIAVFVCLAITLALVIPAVIKKKTYRWQGIALLALYFGFMIYNVIYVIQG